MASPRRHSSTKTASGSAKKVTKSGSRRTSTTRRVNGIPLKRKTVWVYDLNSPEFKQRQQRELDDIRRKDADRDGMDWVEAVISDPDWQNQWR